MKENLCERSFLILFCLWHKTNWPIYQIKPISVKYGLGMPDHDSEGRLVTVEFDKYYLINGYVPNSGEGLRRLVILSMILFLLVIPFRS